VKEAKVPIVFVNPHEMSFEEKLEYLKKVAPNGIEIRGDCPSFYATDRVHTGAYIFEDWSKINFWENEVPAWLIELATSMERKTLIPVQIQLLTPQT
jgi:hypothetical protein